MIIVNGKTTFGFPEKGVFFRMEKGAQHRAFEDLKKKILLPLYWSFLTSSNSSKFTQRQVTSLVKGSSCKKYT
jgi:hypothetical protein